MSRLLILLFTIFSTTTLFGQENNNNVIYIIDSIPVIEDPKPGNEIKDEDIADFRVVKNKDSLGLLGYKEFDGAIFIFTKEYRKRSDDIKRIPSTHQMENKNGVLYFNNIPHSGNFIDYFYNGKKEREGVLKHGTLEGLQKGYSQNGTLVVEREYKGGIPHGIEKHYYPDGILKQKGVFSDGKEIGVWEMYYPNGQVKQKSIFNKGVMDGESVAYYSTGKILATEVAKNGKLKSDKKLEKVYDAMNKGHQKHREGDPQSAIRFYTKAIELDTTYANAYFARGTIRLNNFEFDEAIKDFDKSLSFEPYAEKTLGNRAFARIRKHQFKASKPLSEDKDASVRIAKDNPGIPADELTLICNDLNLAIYLGEEKEAITDAVKEFCEGKK